jgi:hypothetical protein
MLDAVDEDGEPILQDGVQVVNLRFKITIRFLVSKQQASGLLAPTDWYVIKANEVVGYTSTYRSIYL